MYNNFAHEYVHANSIGDLANCQNIMEKSEENIQSLYDCQNIMGYEIILVENDIDVQEKLIGDKFVGVTKGQFPFVYSLVQPIEKSPIDIDRLMEELDYIRVNV